MKWLLGLVLVFGLGFVFSQKFSGTHTQGVSQLEKFSLKITGMTCDHCAKGISGTLKSVFDATDIKVSWETGEAHFSTTQSPSVDDVRKAVEGLGFKVAECVKL